MSYYEKDVFTHYLVLRFECCGTVHTHNQYRLCNIGILFNECDREAAVATTDHRIQIYAVYTVKPKSYFRLGDDPLHRSLEYS